MKIKLNRDQCLEVVRLVATTITAHSENEIRFEVWTNQVPEYISFPVDVEEINNEGIKNEQGNQH